MNERDWEDLELIRSSPEYREALGSISDDSSNAAVAHAIFEEGLRVVKERAAIAVYEQMAADEAMQRESAANRARLSRRGRDLSID